MCAGGRGIISKLCDGGAKALQPSTLIPSHFTQTILSYSLDKAELLECHSHAYTNKAEFAYPTDLRGFIPSNLTDHVMTTFLLATIST